ncbi:MAG: hypothetical protein ACKOBR_08655, partial [Actinomycetota bacterium]
MAKQLRMLAPEAFREHLSRRAFITGGTAAAGFAVLLTACGGSDDAATDDGGTGGEATGDYSRVINKSSGSLAMYTWG